MRYTQLLFIFSIFLIIFSVNIVSATDMVDNSTVLEDSSEYILNDYSDSDLSSEISSEGMLAEDSQSDLSVENEYTIYVGKNTTENGTGSEVNPFATLDLACKNVSNGEDNVIIKIFDGTYELGDYLKFNTTNIHIIGLGNVIIKNKYGIESVIPKNIHQAFGLIPTSGNFKITNVTIDGSTWDANANPDGTIYNSYFNIFRGNGNYNVILDNCNILEYKYFLPNGDKDVSTFPKFIFNNCYFLVDTNFYAYKWGNNNRNNITFKNCIFNLNKISGNIDLTCKNSNNTFEDCWFGVNRIPNEYFGSNWLEYYHFNSYAVFKISEKYLGDNTYEIIGNLVRNGTSEIIESINPMTVTLSSDNEGLNQTTAILKNGTFKVLYTSSASNHKITATLDKETQSIEFQCINITLDSPSITHGDKQNITVTLPKEYNGMIYVTINNKTYSKEVVYTNVITVEITDVLPVGTHEVNVDFIDDETPSEHTYAFNTTKIIVNKATPNVNISREGNLVPGEKLIIKVEIPYATEDVIIIVNGDKNTTKLVDNVATYTIDELTAGTYFVTVVYAGDASYDFAYKTESFDVVKSTQELIKDLNDTVNAQAGTIESQKEQISGLNDTVNAQAGTIANQTKQIDDLNNVINALNNNTNSQKDTNNNQEKVVTKKATKLTAPKKTFKAKTKTKKVKVKLTSGKTVLKNKKVTLKVKGKTYTVKTNKKGIATFKITKLTKKGTFKYTVKFAGDKSYKAVSKKGKIKIK